MTEQKTRAQRMAEQYGAKLDAAKPKPQARQITLSDKQTPEQEKRLREGAKKLADFKDLL